MKKVFQIANHLNLAGTETVFMNWYRNIDNTKLQFDFSVNQEYKTPLVDEILEKGGKIFIIPPPIGVKGRLERMVCLYKILNKNGPYDIVHTHSHFNSSLDCFVAFLARVPKRVIISHTSDGYKKHKHKFLRPFYRLFIFLFSTNCLAVSKEAGETLYGKHISFQLLNNGINLTKFAYNSYMRTCKRRELNVENKFVVGHVGRFSHEKNHEFIIDIYTEIYRRNKESVLLLIGDGVLKKEIEQKVNDLCLDNNVIFLGTQSEINEYYQVMDVFLFPSLYEGLGIAFVEAQCSGLPCFISDAIPSESIICNTTKISLSKSAKEWSNIIIEKTKNFERKDCSEFVRKAGFDIKDTAKQIQQIYLEE